MGASRQEALVSDGSRLLLPCAPIGFSLIAVWCFHGATHRGQQETPALTLSYGRYGLRVRRMAVVWTFRRW